MLTVQHLLIAARELLIGDHLAPELVISSGPLLGVEHHAALASIARQGDHDLMYLQLGNNLEDGPERVHLIAPREIVHVRINCALWAPPGKGLCALVSANGAPGYMAYEDGEIAHFPGRLARDHTPGIQRARERLLARARIVPIDGTERNTRAVLLA